MYTCMTRARLWFWWFIANSRRFSSACLASNVWLITLLIHVWTFRSSRINSPLSCHNLFRILFWCWWLNVMDIVTGKIGGMPGWDGMGGLWRERDGFNHAWGINLKLMGWVGYEGRGMDFFRSSHIYWPLSCRNLFRILQSLTDKAFSSESIVWTFRSSRIYWPLRS